MKLGGYRLEAVARSVSTAVVGDRWKEIAARDAMTTEGARGDGGRGPRTLVRCFEDSGDVRVERLIADNGQFPCRDSKDPE